MQPRRRCCPARAGGSITPTRSRTRSWPTCGEGTSVNDPIVEQSKNPILELSERGRKNFADLVEGGQDRLDALFGTVPALGELAVGTVHGHLHHRAALDPR